MLRDAPIPTLRLLLRIANAFALDFLSISRGDRDFTDALILAVMMQGQAARLGRDPERQRQYAFFETPIPAPLRRALSINAIAKSLSLPFETVRRRTKDLVADGLCEATPEGVGISDALLTSAAHRAALEAAYQAVFDLYQRLARADCLAVMDLPPYAAPFAPGEAAPLRIVWRAGGDYFLRLIEVLPTVPSVTQAFVFMEVFRANSDHLSDAVRGGDAIDEFIPDSQRRPVRAMDVAVRLGLPYETTRRNLKLLVADGRVQRADDAYIVPVTTLAQATPFQAWSANFLSLSRMFADLAQNGVLARWDLELAEARATGAGSHR